MNYLGIATIIGGIITFLITYFDKEEQKFELLKEQYFNKVLCEFYNEYKKNNDINPLKFINRNFKHSDSYIPRYIFDICDKNKKEVLKKVLIVDYYDYYPNKSNTFYTSINKIIDKEYIVEVLFTIFIYICGIILLVLSAINLIIIIIGKFNKNILKELVIYFFLGVFLLWVAYRHSKYIKKYVRENDEYSLEKDKIAQLTKNKEQLFEKYKENYF